MYSYDIQENQGEEMSLSLTHLLHVFHRIKQHRIIPKCHHHEEYSGIWGERGDRTKLDFQSCISFLDFSAQLENK